MSASVAFCLGLGGGLWIAANIWFVRYAFGYKAGVKMAVELLVKLMAEAPVHWVQRMEAAQTTTEETRH
jgi:hypothetical protein